MGRSVFYRPPRSGTIQSVQSLMRINQPPRRRAEMHRVFLISVNVGYCQPSISRECWAALRIKSTTFLVAPPMRWSLPSALSLQNIKAAVSPDCHIERLGQKSQLACIRTLFAPALAGAFFLGTQISTDQSGARTSVFEIEVSAEKALLHLLAPVPPNPTIFGLAVCGVLG